MKINLVTILFLGLVNFCVAQKMDVKLDYEEKPNVNTWWKANDNVAYSLDLNKTNQKDNRSKVCVKVRWDSIGERRSVWFTDIKIDTLANPKMDDFRKKMGSNLWLSFWCNTGKGDTLWLQPLMLTRGHKGKWACTERTPIHSEKWVFVKFDLSKLKYIKTGEGPEIPDLTTDAIRCFEIGFLNGKHSPKGFIEATFDDLMISNYEPLP